MPPRPASAAPARSTIARAAARGATERPRSAQPPPAQAAAPFERVFAMYDGAPTSRGRLLDALFEELQFLNAINHRPQQPAPPSMRGAHEPAPPNAPIIPPRLLPNGVDWRLFGQPAATRAGNVAAAQPAASARASTRAHPDAASSPRAGKSPKWDRGTNVPNTYPGSIVLRDRQRRRATGS